MNKMRKNLVTVLALMIALIGSLSLVGCGSETKAPTVLPDPVENFAIDFESGEFSFDYNSTAKQFYVRIYETGEMDESMPVAARRVRFRSEQTSYEGAVDLGDLQPGDSYDAYVYTYIKDDNGDLIYSICEKVSGIYKTAYKTPAKNIDAVVSEGKITVSLQNGFFTSQFIDKAPNYEIRLYKDGVQAELVTLTAADVNEVEVQTEGFFGMVQTSIERSAQGVFDIDDESAEYYVTVTVISNDDVAYYNSAESAPIYAHEPMASGDASGDPF